MASIKWIGRFAVAASALLAGHSLAASAGPNLLFESATGAVISQDHAGMAWYPASLTKLMTAYLTFEALREGRLKLDQQIPVSSIAAIQPASKIGIGAGSKVSVDFALVTAVTAAIAAAKPPAVKKSGGALKRFWCSATSQSFTGFFGMS